MTTYCNSSDLIQFKSFGFAGEWSQEAYDMLIKSDDLNDIEQDEDFWTDIMQLDGVLYAVAANAPVTSISGNAIYVELDEEEYSQLYDLGKRNQFFE